MGTGAGVLYKAFLGTFWLPLPTGQSFSMAGDLLRLHRPALTLPDLSSMLGSQVVIHGHKHSFHLVTWSFEVTASCKAAEQSNKGVDSGTRHSLFASASDAY